MKRFLSGLCIALSALAIGVTVTDVDAKRLGGGGSSGMRRSLPTQPAQSVPPRPQQAPAQPNNPAPNATPGMAGAAAAQAAPRRSWMGPIAGLAAGLGLAALASHFGFGAGLANFMTTLLVVMAAFFVIRWLMRRLMPASRAAGPQFASAGNAPAWGRPGQDRSALNQPGLAAPVAAGPAGFAPQSPAPARLPPGFDVPAFERAAKLIFIRMQAANDAGDLDDLRRFTTPEMFAVARLDLQSRGGLAQRTDVVQLETQLLDFAREDGRNIVSVRYHGLLREEVDHQPEAFDEVWHLVQPVDGSKDWVIAGIQQTHG
jgi:predicted lipid-binding transport protein (Tim44 family)